MSLVDRVGEGRKDEEATGQESSPFMVTVTNPSVDGLMPKATT